MTFFQKNDNLRTVPVKAPGQVRVLLFSDIHLGLFPRRIGQLLNKRILGSFNHLLRRRHKVRVERIAALAGLMPCIDADVTVCAGDLTSASLPEEFAWALRELEPVKAASNGRFLYVPGNHDAYVNEPEAVAALDNAVEKLNDGRFFLKSLPFAVAYSGIRLILLNPARPCGWMLSCGYLDERQAGRMGELLREGDSGCANVIVTHFPALDARGRLPGMRHGLRGAQFIAGALKEGRAAAVLSGHVHKPYSCMLDNGAGQLCCGSLTLAGSYVVADFQEGRLQRHFILTID